MNIKSVLIVLGEPNSTFSEILLKYFNSKNFIKNRKIITLIGSKHLFEEQMKVLNFKNNLNEVNDVKKSLKRAINILNVNYEFKKPFSKISSNSNEYIENCFKLSFKILKKYKSYALINGPISKKSFLQKKFPGVTEYVANKTKIKKTVMLIYNRNLAVSPVSTHIPIKNVASLVKKKRIIDNVVKINNFYKLVLKIKPKIAVLGLNPHCETISKISEEKKEIIPAIKHLKKKIKVFGPISADTFFLKQNYQKYDAVIGMYHDQVLAPAKTLFKFKAINITLGLPFIKITPDHGPNQEMIGKNKSDPSSIIYAFDFLNEL